MCWWCPSHMAQSKRTHHFLSLHQHHQTQTNNCGLNKTPPHNINTFKRVTNINSSGFNSHAAAFFKALCLCYCGLNIPVWRKSALCGKFKLHIITLHSLSHMCHHAGTDVMAEGHVNFPFTVFFTRVRQAVVLSSVHIVNLSCFIPS